MDNEPHSAPFGTNPTAPPPGPGGEPGSVTSDKQMWRRRLVAAREARAPAERAVAGRLLAAAFAGSLSRAVRTVAAYAAVGTEPPTRVLLDAVASTGRTVLLPVVRAHGVLEWARYEGWDALVPGPLDLREPPGARLGTGALATADLVLAPALAVDRAGTRLGRGAGYYDRALVGVAPTRIYAVVFDDEVLAHLPRADHDRPVGAALTPSGIVPLHG